LAAEVAVTSRRALHARRASIAAAFVLATATVTLYLNRHYNGDVYWLLAAGRYTAHHGIANRDPFLTLSHGREWFDQQWLAGLLFFGFIAAGGLMLLTEIYGLLIGLALLPLVIGCRHKQPRQVLAAWILSLPMLFALLDPRAEGFSLLAFSVLLVLTDVDRRRGRVWWIPLVFALWANLHAAFLVGLLFLGLVVVGAEVDRRRGLATRTFSWRFLAVGLALPATLATPLGTRIVDYLRVLSANKVLPRLTYEWDPTWEHPYALLYPALVLAYGAWLYSRAPHPRPVEPLIVLVGFAIFATTATRQLVWLGPLCFYLLRQLGRPGSLAVSQRVSVPAFAAAAAALAIWAVWVAPPPNEPKLLTNAANYAAAHPVQGRIAAPPGTGSYLLWHASSLRVTIDGRFENYSDAELTGAYDIVDHRGNWRALVARWGVTRVLTRNPRAIEAFTAAGWRVRYNSGGHAVLDQVAR
jgi:hypothetical protein